MTSTCHQQFGKLYSGFPLVSASFRVTRNSEIRKVGSRFKLDMALIRRQVSISKGGGSIFIGHKFRDVQFTGFSLISVGFLS